ncbi:unnamed protein product [Dibothriocephalus latus]|uniref:Uncharacterized protein n=1 Tax=Dibothriocephalus latus TaxID=60516 RepID=A0A3P7LYQ7_DIBLA|nr:unnamed protein product [Dibothriocephalus latus]
MVVSGVPQGSLVWPGGGEMEEGEMEVIVVLELSCPEGESDDFQGCQVIEEVRWRQQGSKSRCSSRFWVMA